jgi:lipoprotein NlpD
MGILDKVAGIGGAVAALAALVAASALVLGACTFTPWPSSSKHLVDDEASASAAASEAEVPGSGAVATPVPVPSVTEVPAASSTAGFYRVKAGDTLYRIAAAHKQRPADIAAWNKLPASGAVKVGQLLRVSPPTAGPAATPAKADPAPAPAAAAAANAPAPAPAPPASAAAKADTQSSAGAREHARLAWPMNGSVATPFSPGKSRGIVIAGAPGEPVKAAAAGRVVYAGSGMKGYGKLVIVKHDAHLITAYGRNGRLLVKQGDTVKQGQQIATSGADAAGVGTLLFEVRENGKPVDPLAQLPRKAS